MDFEVERCLQVLGDLLGRKHFELNFGSRVAAGLELDLVLCLLGTLMLSALQDLVAVSMTLVLA